MRLVGDAIVHGLREVDDTGPIGFCGTRVDSTPFEGNPGRMDCRACHGTRAWRRHFGDLRSGRYSYAGKGRHRRTGT